MKRIGPLQYVEHEDIITVRDYYNITSGRYTINDAVEFNLKRIGPGSRD